MDQAQTHFAPLTATMIRRTAPIAFELMPLPRARALVQVTPPPFLTREDIHLFIMTYAIGLILFLTWLA